MGFATQRSLGQISKSWTCRVCARRSAILFLRWSSTEAAPPPLLTKIKGDLKAAMKAKDTARLNVLRAVISDTNNASKTSSPIRTDLQILALLRKRKAASEAASSEAQAANRVDLQEKQQAEIAVIDEYASSVQLMSEEEISRIVSTVIDRLKSIAADAELKAGSVLKEVFKPGGELDGKSVDKAQVTKAVTAILSGKS